MEISGDHWPIFLYQGYTYDSEDPWNGLLQSTLLVSVSLGSICVYLSTITTPSGLQTHIHIPKLC
jgi:hypothetical protein